MKIKGLREKSATTLQMKRSRVRSRPRLGCSEVNKKELHNPMRKEVQIEGARNFYSSMARASYNGLLIIMSQVFLRALLALKMLLS